MEILGEDEMRVVNAVSIQSTLIAARQHDEEKGTYQIIIWSGFQFDQDFSLINYQFPGNTTKRMAPK